MSGGGARRELDSTVQGTVIGPGDPGYDRARGIFNTRYDRDPAMIVRCAGAADVAAAVRIARRHGLAIAVKSGGHDYGGRSASDGGLLIDLSAMNVVEVDPASQVARAGPGARWADLDHETQAVGLATPGPTVSSVGLGGAALLGGTGHLSRRHGLALDQVRSIEVVTADSDLVRASVQENSDLYWALRGGGGSFGVATGFELSLHEVGPEVLAGQVVYPLEQARDVLLGYRDAMSEASDDLQCYAVFLRLPPVDDFAEQLHGEVALSLVVFHAEPSRGGELGVFARLGSPISTAIGPMTYLDSQKMFDPGAPQGHRWESKAHCLDELTDGAVDVLVEQAASIPNELTIVYLEPYGGAVGRVDRAATAFPHRNAAFSCHVLAAWADAGDDEAISTWARSVRDAMAAFANGGVYANLLGADEDARIPAAFGENLERLRRIKRRYDPDNVLRGNVNVAPLDS